MLNAKCIIYTSMTPTDLQKRTKQFSLQGIFLVDSLPHTPAGRTVLNQFIRCVTSVGANYRAACRARSRAEFISKIGIVIEEADESCYWLEIAIDAKLLSIQQVEPLLKEARELTAIMIASANSAAKNRTNINN